MVRNVIGSVLALVGAAAAVWSPFRAWYDGRHGSTYRIDDLFSGISADKAPVAGSILLPFAFAALVTIIAVVLRSRVLVIVAAVVVLGFAVLWMVRQGQAAGSLTIDSSGKGLGQGVALALGGGLVMLIGAALMAGRRAAPPASRYGVPATDERTAARHDRHGRDGRDDRDGGPPYDARETGGAPVGRYDTPTGEAPYEQPHATQGDRTQQAEAPYPPPGSQHPDRPQYPGEAPHAPEPPRAETPFRHASDSPYAHGHPVGAPYEPRSTEPLGAPSPEEPPEEPPADEPRLK